MADDVFPDLEGYDTLDVENTRRARKVAPVGRLDPYAVLGGVTVTWLSKVFGMDSGTVKKRLKGAPAVRVTPRGPLYDLAVAARRLAPNEANFRQFLRDLKPADVAKLPARFQSHYWTAMQRRHKTELEARDLWKTDDVLQVLGEAAKAIKGTVLLWADTVDRQVGLSKEARDILRAQVDELLDQIHEVFIKRPSEDCHRAVIADIPDRVLRTEAAEDGYDIDDMEDDSAAAEDSDVLAAQEDVL